MTGLDLILAVLLVCQIYLAFRRGFIGEFFDIVAFLGACLVGLWIYLPFGKQIDHWTDWGLPVGEWLSFALCGIPVAVGLLLVGMHLDRVVRDDHKIPDTVLNWAGLVFGVFKALVACWLFLMLIKASPFYSDSNRDEFKDAPLVHLVQNTGGTFGMVVFDIIAPATARKDLGPFLRKGL